MRQTARAVGAVDSPLDPAMIRNIAVVGPAGAGPTTLVGALLRAADAIEPPVSVADGDDSEPSVPARPDASGLVCTSLWHDGVKVNLLNAPSEPDFAGELRAGLRAADGVLFVVSAGGGAQQLPAVAAVWEECAALGVPRAVAISQLDDPQADLDEMVALCERFFSDSISPLYLPLLDDDGVRVTGLIGLLTGRVLDYSAGFPPLDRDPELEHSQGIQEASSELVEAILAESEDETLMDRYLDGELLDGQTLIDELETAVARGAFHPMIPVCADTGLGLDALLELLTQGFPSPLERPLPVITRVDGAPHDPLHCDPMGPLVAEVVKTTADPSGGRVSLVRVFSGTLRRGQAVQISGHTPDAPDSRPARDQDQHVRYVYVPRGGALSEAPVCIAGDIGAISIPGASRIGDTVSDPDAPLLVAAWEVPELPSSPPAPERLTETVQADRLAP